MSKKIVRLAALAAVALVALLPPAAAAAPPAVDAGVQGVLARQLDIANLLSLARTWLSSSWLEEGSSMDPDGSPVAPEAGSSMDPDGSPAVPEAGSSMDPDGGQPPTP